VIENEIGFVTKLAALIFHIDTAIITYFITSEERFVDRFKTLYGKRFVTAAPYLVHLQNLVLPCLARLQSF
jgi:uncharacterized membrane protein (GlpM family)